MNKWETQHYLLCGGINAKRFSKGTVKYMRRNSGQHSLACQINLIWVTVGIFRKCSEILQSYVWDRITTEGFSVDYLSTQCWWPFQDNIRGTDTSSIETDEQDMSTISDEVI